MVAQAPGWARRARHPARLCSAPSWSAARPAHAQRCPACVPPAPTLVTYTFTTEAATPTTSSARSNHCGNR